MKKIIIGVVVLIIIGAGVYFGTTQLQKGSLGKLPPRLPGQFKPKSPGGYQPGTPLPPASPAPAAPVQPPAEPPPPPATPSLPDLRVKQITATFTGITHFPGDPENELKKYDIVTTVYNHGPAINTPFAVDMLITNAAGGSYTRTHTFQSILAESELSTPAYDVLEANNLTTVTATVDSGNTIAESFENNNALTIQVAPPLPDLMVKQVTATFTGIIEDFFGPESNLKKYDIVTTVYNNGPAINTPFTVNMLITNTAGGSYTRTHTFQSILAGLELSTPAYDVLEANNLTTVTATVDSGNTIAESSENNNSLTIQVPPLSILLGK